MNSEIKLHKDRILLDVNRDTINPEEIVGGIIIPHSEKHALTKTITCKIKQINEELAYLKKWATSSNDLLRKDADLLLQIRCKELKFLVASRYASITDEIHNGYKALERYFEEISKFYSPVI